MRNGAAFGSVFDRIVLLAAAARIARIFGTTVVFFSTACQQKKKGLRWCLFWLHQPARASREISPFFFFFYSSVSRPLLQTAS